MWLNAKKTALFTTLTKINSENNCSQIYLYYDCNRPKWDLQNNILQIYISVKVLDIIGVKHSKQFMIFMMGKK